MKREARPHFETVRLEVALEVAERENNRSRTESNRGKEYSNFGGPMASQFDVFLSEPGGDVMWQGAAATLKDAEEMIKSLARNSSAREYIIFNLRTGEKILVKAEGLYGTSSKENPSG